VATSQIGSVCYPSSEAAAAAASSNEVGSIVQVGGVSYVVDVAAVSASSITYNFSDVGSGASFQKVAPFTAPPCGLLDTSDGLAMGWGVATAWLVTAGVLFLRRGLHE